MKSAIFAAAFALSVPAVYAQVTGLPDCAGACLVSGFNASGCPPSDIKCACMSTVFVQSAQACLEKACSSADYQTALGAASKLCQSYGVTIPTVPGPTTSAPAAASTTVAPETSTGVSTIDTSAPVETPYPYPGTTTLTTFTTTVIGTGTGSMIPTGNSSTPTVAPPPSNSEAAAVKNIASFGAMAMAVAGLFAL